MDWPFQLFVCVVDAAFLVQLYRRRDSSQAGWLLLALGVAFFGVLLFAANMFHVMRLTAWLVFVHAPLVGFVSVAWLWATQRRLALALLGLSSLSLVIAVDAFPAFAAWSPAEEG